MRILILFISLLLSLKVSAMPLINPTKACVFSAVKARLTMNGEPLKNVTVIRRWEWRQLKEESTTTDENGFFRLPAIFESSITRMLPIELVIAQGLYLIVDGEERKLWSNSKRTPEENAEFGVETL